VVGWRPVVLHGAGLALLVGALALLGACATQPKPRPVQLDFLQAARVTRADVDAHLGPPSATFTRDRVVSYRLSQTAAQGYSVVPQNNPKAPIDWQGINYDLVLALDEAGIVSEYRLIPIHPPPALH
jgi:hypothetical protein